MKSNALCKIVFLGQFLDKNLSYENKRNIAKIIGIKEIDIEYFCSGREFILKNNIPYEEALLIADKFKHIGLVIEIRSVDSQENIERMEDYLTSLKITDKKNIEKRKLQRKIKLLEMKNDQNYDTGSFTIFDWSFRGRINRAEFINSFFKIGLIYSILYFFLLFLYIYTYIHIYIL